MKSPRVRTRTTIVACALSLTVPALLGACSTGTDATSTTSGSSSSSGGAGGSTTSTGAGGDATTGAGGASTGTSGSTTGTTGAGGAGTTTGQGAGGGGSVLDQLAALLEGEWEPTAFQNGGNPEEPAPAGSPFTLFQAGGKVSLGCGQAPSGTWALLGNAPAPAIAQIQVVLNGNNNLTWYVITLDKETLVFAEGGDFFSFKRSSCP